MRVSRFKIHKNQVAGILAVVLGLMLLVNFVQVFTAAGWSHEAWLAFAQTAGFALAYAGIAFAEFAELPPSRKWAALSVRVILGVLALLIFFWVGVQNVLATFTDVALPSEVAMMFSGWGLSDVQMRFTWALLDALVRVLIEGALVFVIAVLLSLPEVVSEAARVSEGDSSSVTEPSGSPPEWEPIPLPVGKSENGAGGSQVSVPVEESSPTGT